MDKIFVIIVTYNGKHWYERCFGSLNNSTIPITTVVIDNASEDDTVDFIKKEYPKIILIESNKNLGFGQANNIGIRYALNNGADYVFLLNQDAWIEPDSINELIKISKKNTEYGVLGPMLLSADKKHISKGYEYYLQSIDDNLFIEDLYFNKIKDIYSVKMVAAAAWLLPKKTLNIVGEFDPIFFHYGEDDQYAQRVFYHKLKIGICPKIKVVHDSENIMLPGKIEFIKDLQLKQRILLLHWVDINKKFSSRKIIKNYVKDIIIQLFKCNINSIYMKINELSYFLKIRKKIIKSRSDSKKNNYATNFNNNTSLQC